MIRIFINGFGRIGRTLLRQILTDPRNNDIEVVGLNDIAPLETCAYLFRYDSVFGPYPGAFEWSEGRINVEGREIPFHAASDLTALDLSHVDVVLECTGTARTRARAEGGLEAGARSVLISGPSDAADVTVVLGANDADLGEARIVSNASCTTNAIAPMLKTLDDAFGIESGHISTVHCYTGSQPLVDVPKASFARSRAAAVSMVPTTTSAADQVIKVLPEFADRLSVAAVRVPCISVSAVDAVLRVANMPADPQEALRGLFAENGVIGLTEDPCVSTDMRARPESLVVALPETMAVADGQIRVFGWYDNEWGFSARMLDMVRKIAGRTL